MAVFNVAMKILLIFIFLFCIFVQIYMLRPEFFLFRFCNLMWRISAGVLRCQRSWWCWWWLFEHFDTSILCSILLWTRNLLIQQQSVLVGRKNVTVSFYTIEIYIYISIYFGEKLRTWPQNLILLKYSHFVSLSLSLHLYSIYIFIAAHQEVLGLHCFFNLDSTSFFIYCNIFHTNIYIYCIICARLRVLQNAFGSYKRLSLHFVQCSATSFSVTLHLNACCVYAYRYLWGVGSLDAGLHTSRGLILLLFFSRFRWVPCTLYFVMDFAMDRTGLNFK
jgi:hypothetical protein